MRLTEYKNKDARNAAIQRIIHNLNIPGLTIQEVNIIINNIHSIYSQEKSKIKKSKGTGSGVDDIYVPSLAWFEIADRFLSGIIKSRKRFQNVMGSNEYNMTENSQNISECSSGIPTYPSSDISAYPSSDIPANSSPDIPANDSPDIPVNPSPDISANPLLDIPIIFSTRTSDNAPLVVPSNRKKMKKLIKHDKTLNQLRHFKQLKIRH